MTNILDGIKTFALLERSLDLRALKHLQIVSNVANATNPEYQAFEAVLDGAMKGLSSDGSKISMAKTHERHLSPGGTGAEGVEYEPQTTEMEQEMARLTENNLMYNASVEMLNRQLRQLMLVIQDRA